MTHTHTQFEAEVARAIYAKEGLRATAERICLITRNAQGCDRLVSVHPSLGEGSFIADAEVCAIDERGRPNFGGQFPQSPTR